MANLLELPSITQQSSSSSSVPLPVPYHSFVLTQSMETLVYPRRKYIDLLKRGLILSNYLIIAIVLSLFLYVTVDVAMNGIASKSSSQVENIELTCLSSTLASVLVIVGLFGACNENVACLYIDGLFNGLFGLVTLFVCPWFVVVSLTPVMFVVGISNCVLASLLRDREDYVSIFSTH